MIEKVNFIEPFKETHSRQINRNFSFLERKSSNLAVTSPFRTWSVSPSPWVRFSGSQRERDDVWIIYVEEDMKSSLQECDFMFTTQIQSTETICSCVCVQVSSLLWMRRQRRGVLPLKPIKLCLGNMAATAELRGKKRISDCLWLSLSISELSSNISSSSSLVWVKAVCVCVCVCVCVLCWSPKTDHICMFTYKCVHSHGD